MKWLHLQTQTNLIKKMKKAHNFVKVRPLTTLKEALRSHSGALFFSFLVVFYLSGCSLIPTAPRPVQVKTIAEMPNIYDPPLPLELQLVDIDWTIFTPELMQQYLVDIESGNAPRQAFYSLTTKEYENLSMNTADQKRYIKEILSIVKYYRELDEKKNTGQTEK